MPDIDIKGVLFGSDHKTLKEAVLADIVSALPLIGGATDILRAATATNDRRKVLQILDALAEPIPIINQLTMTNTVLYLDRTGKIDLRFIDDLISIAKRYKQ